MLFNKILIANVMKVKSLILTMIPIFSLIGCVDNDSDKDRISSLKVYAIEQTSETELDGGKYKVFNSNNEAVGEYTTSNGYVTVSYLPYGKYTIEEIHPPQGFYCNLKKQTIDLSSTYSENVTFYYKSHDPVDPPASIKLSFYDSDAQQTLAEYNCIKIGEYYWTDKNFTHSVPAGADFENAHIITQNLLNKYMDCAFLDKSQYQLKDINDFEKYFGRYYSRPSVAYIMKYGEMHSETGRKIEGWGLPLTRDYQQLFAMCPFSSNTTRLDEVDVRFALAAKEGDNPVAKNILAEAGNPYRTYWFDPQYVTNIYGFGLMPGGARLNGDGPWSNGLGPNDGYWDGKKGDIYHLFYTANFVARTDEGGVGAVAIHDQLDTRGFNSYHLYNMRWAKRLSDQELGYKLYINSAQTDIKKLGLEDPVPNGYTELPNGYIRGFYVQYILDKDNPKVSVQDVVSYAKQVDDPAAK